MRMPVDLLVRIGVAALALLVLVAPCAAAGPVVGWRGDGTGKYPAADPPAHWQRISSLMKGLRYAAAEPKEADAGKPMPDGVVREWLVLGPVSFSKDLKIDKEALPGEAALDPEEGQRTGEGTWKKVTLDTAYLDLAALLGKAGEAVAAPLVIGDRVYVLSEPFDLIALAKADGKVLWLRRASYFEAATDAEKKKTEYKDAEAVAARVDALNAAFVAGTATEKQLQEKTKLEKSLQKAMKKVDPEKYAIGLVPDVGWSGFTPVSDGERIYTWSSSGLVTCSDLGGRLLWTRLARQPDVEHGLSSSPVLAGGKIVIFNRDLVAFDARTGAPAWTTPIVAHEGLNPGGFFHGSLIAVTAAGVPLIALGNGTIVRAADGKKIYENKIESLVAVGHWAERQERFMANPVPDGKRLYLRGEGGLWALGRK